MLTFYWPRIHQAHESSLPDEERLDRVRTVIKKIPENITTVLARLSADDRFLFFGLGEKPPVAEMNTLVSVVNRHLSVTINSGAMTATITYRHRDPAVAFRIMKLLVDDCLEREGKARLKPTDYLLLLHAALTKELASLGRDKAALHEGSPRAALADLDSVISEHRARLDLVAERLEQFRSGEPEIRIATSPMVSGPYIDLAVGSVGFWRMLKITTIGAIVLGLFSILVVGEKCQSRTGINPLEQ